MSLRQAYELWESFADQKMWLDSLLHDSTFSVYIEKDWSTRYDRVGDVTVGGARPLMVSQFRVAGVPPEVGNGLSLCDCEYTAEEIQPDGGRRPVISIPAYNSVTSKGFLLFFTPPVASGETRRTHTEFRMAREFANTLAKGRGDRVSYSARRLAKDHRIKLLFRILIDKTLPPLTIKSQFGGTFVPMADEADASRGCFYRRYECQLDWQAVAGVISFDVNLER